MDNVEILVEKIRRGEIDINNQELFFSTLIKGLILKLNEEISIRNIKVPHYILHTGSDALYLENKGYDQSIEPYSISNENYTYTAIPKCIVTPGSIDLMADQLTNPYSRGHLQYEDEEMIYTLSGEFRRFPVKLGIELKYFTDTYRDMLELVQQILTKLAFIKTFNITYLGQMIQCSYKIPDSLQDEHLTELDGSTQEDKSHTLSISLEIETNLPVFSAPTITPMNHLISDVTTNFKFTE